MNKEEAKIAIGLPFHGMIVPGHMHGGMLRYAFDYCPVGEFLEAVISNDLRDAVGRADDDNITNIPALVFWFYNHAPGECWGSREKYRAWLLKAPIRKERSA